MELERLSYSSLSTYLTCPEQFRLTKIESLPDKVGWYNIGGTAVHAMTEQVDIHSLGGDPPADFNWYFDKALAEQQVLTPDIPTEAYISTGKGVNTENETWWRNRGPALVQAWTRWLDASPYMIWITPEGEPAIELEMNSTFGGVPSLGFIDRILCETSNPVDPFVVVDLKNGKPPKDKVQLATYGEACKQRGWDIRYGGYFMTRGAILTGLHDLTELMGPRIDHQFAEVWRGVQSEVFPPRPSGLCANHCGVAKFCYAGGQLEDKSHLPYKESNA